MKRASANMAVDMVIGAAFVASLISTRHDLTHLGVGVVLACGSVTHIVLHGRWMVRQTKIVFGRREASDDARRRMKTRPLTMVNYTVDMTVFVMFAVCAVTGLALVFTEDAMIVSTHSAAGGLFAAGVLAHMTLKWRSLLMITERAFKKAQTAIGGSRTIRADAND